MSIEPVRQREVLSNLIQQHFGEDPIVGIEIGVLEGNTAGFLLDKNKNLFLYSIDPEPCKVRLGENIGANKDRFKLIKKESDDAGNDIPEQVDFVWIDGDHSYAQVKRDIINYLPLAKTFIGGHDYGSTTEECVGVKIAVDEMFGDKITVCDDLVWWVKI